jgi:hypothetical protein
VHGVEWPDNQAHIFTVSSCGNVIVWVVRHPDESPNRALTAAVNTVMPSFSPDFCQREQITSSPQK